MKDKPLRGFEPNSREAKISKAMMDAAEAHPEYQGGDRCIVMYYGPEWSSIAHGGYEEADKDLDPMVDMLMSLTIIFEANGTTLSLVPLGVKGQG